MTCSRCSAAIVTPEQAERGLCGNCLTGASLSALVGLAASHRPLEGLTMGEQWAESGHRVYDPKTDTSRTERWPCDAAWKRDTFPQETQ